MSSKDIKDFDREKTTPRVNSVFRIDNSHEKVTYPHINVNKHTIEEHNDKQSERISTLFNHRDNAQKTVKLHDIDVSESKSKIKAGKIAELDEDVFKKTADIITKYDHKPVSNGLLNVAENSSKIAKAAKVGGKALGAASAISDVITIGQSVSDDLRDDNRIGEDTFKAVARVGGETIGAVAGAKGGAAVGAWIFGAVAGFASGGLLAAPAAALGGVIGGFLGGIGGSYAGGWLFEEGVDAVVE